MLGLLTVGNGAHGVKVVGASTNHCTMQLVKVWYSAQYAVSVNTGCWIFDKKHNSPDGRIIIVTVFFISGMKVT